MGDAVDGGAGTDTLNIIRTAAYTTPVSATVKNIETSNVTTGATVTLDASGWTGLTTLNTTGVGGATVTAAATTDVSVTDSAMVTTIDGNISINGGKNVTATLTAANATTDADPAAEIVVGAVTAAAGTVAVTLTGAYADGADNTMSNIAVTGGTTVGVTTKAGLTAAQTVAQAADGSNFTITQSAVAVTGDANTTAITVTQDAAVAEVDSTGTNGKIGIVNGAVTITGFGLVSTGITGADLSSNTNIKAYTAAGANLTVLNLDVTADDAGAGTGANQALAVEANATGAGQAAGVTYTVTNGILTLGGAGAAAVDTLGEWLVEAAAVAATAGDVLGFQFGADTYVFAQNGTADVLVQLVGVAGTSLVEVSNATTASAGAILYADL